MNEINYSGWYEGVNYNNETSNMSPFFYNKTPLINKNNNLYHYNYTINNVDIKRNAKSSKDETKNLKNVNFFIKIFTILI